MTEARKSGAGCGAEFPLVWRWKSRLPGRFGQRCRVLLEFPTRLWIEFEDGWRTYCSPFAVRRWDPRRDRPAAEQQLTLEGIE